MRTTLDLPDDLFRQLKAKAALAGETLKKMLRSSPVARAICQNSF